MPGTPSHMLLVEEAAALISPSTHGELADILQRNPAMLRLGAIGPDMAFFAPDFGQWSVDFVEVLADWYDSFIGPVVAMYEDYVEPVLGVLDEIEEGVEEVLDDVTCGLVGGVADEIDAFTDRLGAIGQSLILTIFSRAINVFDQMTPPLQEGKSEEEWFWFDYLHNRRTGRFITEMWSRADTDPKRAYVLGYASHYAVDFVGHQFVNTVVGGPARSHLQRHHFAENIIDVHFYSRLRGGELTGAKVHRWLPHGEDVDRLGTLRTILDQPNEVPADMAPVFAMIHDSMVATYGQVPHPQRIDSEYLTVENLNTAFWFMLAALKAMTSAYIPAPEFPGDDIMDAVNEAMKDFLETAGNPPEPPSGPADLCFDFWSDDCDFSWKALKEWLDFLWDSIVYLGELLVYIGKILRDLLALIGCALTVPAKLVVHGVFWIAHSTLHSLLMLLREALVMAAYVHPETEWVDSNPLAQTFLVVSQRQFDEAGDRLYPHRAQQSNEGFHAYPQTPIEYPATMPGPFLPGSPATDLISGLTRDDSLLASYAAAPAVEDAIATGFATVGQSIDSAVPLTVRLMQALAADDFDRLAVDWSMDADRGHAYRNWRIHNPGSLAWDSQADVQHGWAEP